MDFIAFDDAMRLEGGRAVGYVPITGVPSVLPQAPRFLFGDLSASTTSMLFEPSVLHPLGYYVVPGGALLREGLVMHNGAILTGTSTNHPVEFCQAIAGMIDLNALAWRKVPGRAISLIGPGWGTWGHWLVDFLPRLYLFRSLGWCLNDLTWVLPAKSPRYAFEMLERLGVRDSALLLHDHEREILQVDELLVPQNVAAGNIVHPFYSEAAAWIRRTLLQSGEIAASRARKIFIARRHQVLQEGEHEWRALLNRTTIEAIAGARGYTILDTRGLSLLEQLSFYSGASHIAGEYGSGLHNSIFAPPGIVITSFRGTGPAAGVIQSGLAQALGQQIGYVFGALRPDDPQESYTINPIHAELGLDFAARIA